MGFLAIALKLAGALPPVDGWASLTVLISFVAGVQLIVLGTIGVYVAKDYEQGKGRPLYLVADMHGFESAARSPDDVLGAERHARKQPLDSLQPR